MTALFRNAGWDRGDVCTLIMLYLAVAFVPHEYIIVAYHTSKRYIKHSLVVCTLPTKMKPRTRDKISDSPMPFTWLPDWEGGPNRRAVGRH